MGEAIGIDLGTTNSGAGYFEDGKVRILPTTQSEPITPSVISYDERKDRLWTGRSAWQKIERFPNTTVFSIKRLIGRTFDDDDFDNKVKPVLERFGYVIVHADDPQDKGIRVQLGNDKLSPVDISAEILGRVKADASRALDNRPVTHAVITVPAYFSERQKAATRQAAEKAGLVVKKIVDEPTAAAVAFGMQHADERHQLLVYDLGGGTFDVSLLLATRQQFQVKGIEGDNWLGGDDFDLEIVKRILAWVQDNERVDLSQDKVFLATAKKKAQQAKIALSGQDETEIYDEFKMETGQVITVDMEITRQEFESWIRDYVLKSMDLVRKLLSDQGVTPDDLTAVLLVGGSTTVPLVHESLYKMFGREKVKRDIDPLQCVALGAGILAARLKAIECPQCSFENQELATACASCGYDIQDIAPSGDVSLGEVTSKTLGLEVVRGRTAGMFSPIIEKGRTYPVEVEREYYSMSDRNLRLPIYQGEAPLAVNNELQAIVAFELPESIPKNTPVTVTFGLDKDQVLTVSVNVHGYPDLRFEEIVKRDQARPVKEEDQPQEEDRWKRSLQNMLSLTSQFLDEYGSYLPTGIQKKLTSDMDRARQAISEDNATEGKRIHEALLNTILGSGTATQLFMVEQIIEDVEEEEADVLKRGVKALHTAHEGGDREREEKLATGLGIRVNRFFEKKKKRDSYEQASDFKGLLLEKLMRR